MSRSPALKRLQDEVLEAPDLGSLAQILTRRLPEALGIPEATLLLWDRKLDSFEALTPGETRPRAVRPGQDRVTTPAARFLMDMVDRLERMTMETLDFARGGGRLARRSMDAAELVEAITADLAEQLPTSAGPGARFRILLPLEPPSSGLAP